MGDPVACSRPAKGAEIACTSANADQMAGRGAPTCRSIMSAACPVPLVHLVFALLPLRDNRVLATCSCFLRRAGSSPLASPIAIELRIGRECKRAEALIDGVSDMRPQRLSIRSSGERILSLAALANLAGLRSLTLESRSVAGFPELTCLSELTILTVRRASSHRTLETTIGHMTRLQRLHLQYDSDYRPRLAVLSGLTRLERLTVEDPMFGTTRSSFWAPLTTLPALTDLRIFEHMDETPPLPVELADKLAHLALRWVDFPGGFGCVSRLGAALRSLDVCFGGHSERIAALMSMTHLDRLALRFHTFTGREDSDESNSMAMFSRLQRLQYLTLRGLPIRNLEHVDKMTSLSELRLEYCERLTSLDGIAVGLPMRALELLHCGFLANVGCVAHAARLASLVIRGCPGLWGEASSLGAVAAVNLLSGLTFLELDVVHNRPEMSATQRHLAFPASREHKERPVVSEGSEPGWQRLCSLCGCWRRRGEIGKCGAALCTHMVCRVCLPASRHSYDASAKLD